MTPLRMMLLLTAFPAAVGCRSEAVSPPERPPIPVRAAVVEAVAAARNARFSASLAPLEQMTLAFKSGGYVDALLQIPAGSGSRTVQPGDRVANDAVLARLRDAEHRAGVQQAEAAVAEAEAARTKARADVQRTERLLAVDSATAPELASARLAADVSDARVRSAQAALDLAQISLADTSLRAPFAGVILERRIERGSLAAPGSPAFALADVRSVKAVFGVPDSMLASLRLGAPLTMTSDIVPGRSFPGRVTALAPAASTSSRVFDVEVTVPNADGVLKPGMIATVHMAGSGSPSTVAVVPLASVVRDEATPDGYMLFVVEDHGDYQVARARAIRLGQVVGNGIEVVAGVSAGDRVVVTGASRLKRDDRIRVVP